MNKKLAVWTTVILAGALILGYQYIQKLSRDQRASLDSLGAARARAADPQTSPTTAPATAPAPTPAPATTTTQPAAAPASAPAAAPTPTPAPRAAAPTFAWYQLPSDSAGEQKIIPAGDLDPGTGYLFQANFDRTGASVQTLKLSDIFVTVADKQAWEDCNGDHAKYMAEVAKSKASGGPLRGHYSLLNPVSNYRAYATQRITLRIKGTDAELPAILLGQMTWKYEGLQPTSKPAEGMEVAFSATLSTDQYFNNPAKRNLNLPAVKITKTYTVTKNDYSLKTRLKVENLSNVPLEAYIDQLGPAGVPREEHYRGGDDRFMLYGKEKDNSGNVETIFKPHAEIQDGKVPLNEPMPIGRSDDANPVLWVGDSNKFFASMVYLQPVMPNQLAAPAWQADFYYLAVQETPKTDTTPESNVHIPAVRIGGRRGEGEAFAHVPNMLLPVGKPGKEITFDIFTGPKNREMLTNSSAKYYSPLYSKLHYVDAIHYQSCCMCGVSSLTLGMMWLLDKISIIAFGNYGIAIIILVILVRLVLHPLTKKSQINMMKMQKLGPEMERIKKKYADDKEAMNKEMMKFYKTQGAAPLLGCLPMFLQMPIWISLWGALSIAVELRHAAFLPIWITDLAAPDVIFSFPAINIPLIGSMTGPISSFNLLPLLLTVAMFIQAKLNPQMAGAAGGATKEQQTQQKMMRFMMPAMMLLIFYNAASGLTLYIMTSTFAGVIEQIVIKRHIEAKQAIEAAMTTTVRVPGKAPRDSRPKKPKGPNFFKRG